MKPHKGTIRNAHRATWGGSTVIIGEVYGNAGFADGSTIHTSRVISERGCEVETLNSMYTVEWA